MKLKIWEIALAAALIFTVALGSLINSQAEALSNKLIRLHVVANSDSQTDQELKLKVRDAVLDELTTSLDGAENRDEAAEIISENLGRLESAAAGVISASGAEYNVKAELCRESFPTTDYETFSLPAGIYDSLKITIGKGSGHNWWCVVFPPVCSAPVLDESTADAVGLTGEEVALLTEDSGGYVVKFRIMELLGKLKSLIFG